MRRKRKAIECIEYLSVDAPLKRVEYLEEKQSRYIREYVKNKEFLIVGTMRRHGFSQRDVDRQWDEIVDKIRRKKVDGVLIANMAAVSASMPDAYTRLARS